jgi:hypothetical protein
VEPAKKEITAKEACFVKRFEAVQNVYHPLMLWALPKWEAVTDSVKGRGGCILHGCTVNGQDLLQEEYSYNETEI